MKVRLNTGKQTLAFINGTNIGDTFDDFEKWTKKQRESGVIEVWAGRWWLVSADDCVPFKVSDGNTHCSHPKYKSKIGLDTHEFSGFFAYEAWRRAKRSHDFWFTGISKLSGQIVDSIPNSLFI